MQEAETQLVAANADIRGARAQLFPSFSLTADGGLTSYQLIQRLAGPLGVYEKAVLSAFGDVENALAEVRNARDAVSTAQTSARTAESAAGLASTGYRGGTGTVLVVLLRETTVYSARDSLAQARLLHMQALVNLTAALGGGWQR